MSPRRNWDSPPTPLSPASVPLPPEPGEGAHSPADEGLGESRFRRLEKSLALCQACYIFSGIFPSTKPIECPGPAQEMYERKKLYLAEIFLVLKFFISFETGPAMKSF
jgi:hypothetical protein